MIPMLRSLMEFGQRLTVVETSVVKGEHYRFDLATMETVVSEAPWTRLSEPKRTSGKVPFTFHDQPRFLFGIGEPALATSFWDHTKKVLKEAGDTEALREVERALENRAKWKFPKLEPRETTILLTWKGEPLTERPKVRAWWSRKYRVTFLGEEDGEPTDVCILTGEPCVPARLHPQFRIAGGGQTVPLIAFQEQSYKYRGREKGDNFPTAPWAATAYGRGLSTLLKDKTASTLIVPSKGMLVCTLVMWAGDALEHPIIPTAIRLMGEWAKREVLDELWTAIENIPAEDARPIHLAILRGTTGRVSVMNYAPTTAGALRANLLRFRADMKNATRSVSFARLAHQKGGGGTFLPAYYIAHLAWATLMGLPYPQAMWPWLEANYNAETSNALYPWMTAFDARRRSHA